MPSPSVCVCVPTYDERESLPRTVAALRRAVPEADLLVIDDNSPDGTGAVAEEIAGRDPHVRVLHRPGKAGLGPAYVAGFRWALAQGYDVVAQMDADGSHRPEDLPRLLSALSGADAVLGSRWVPGGEARDWPWRREVLSRTANHYVRLALQLPLGDATGGFRAFRRHALERVDLDGVQCEGYCFQVDVARRLLAAGLRVVEVPIVFLDRELGTSKMSGRIVREALLRVTGWALEPLLGKDGRDADRGPRRQGSVRPAVSASTR
ncbi:polyprenol monophosphomannose synthase [Blastococcus xanthinilyticus]|uniref:Dolichol-phosphate mannosyltransferase n=1 Tax=Blastococcus xanthinilyticus TaxID=1564164 RepID=A0A5S5CWD2_9ACTN|nr:polyprenol monophosphomannose synthase [Blastococcus xanthinilyticus]TYP88100.1 dolichol-phosphate mannosyltransferase [Blastococcus xanthinilyticus]